MFQRLQRFIFVWPGDEDVSIGFNGDLFVIPSRDVVADPGSCKPYRFPSAKNKLGQPIPGTIEISDNIKETGPGGGYVKIFDAAECCAWLEDTREDLFNRGFAIVMDVEDIETAMAEGRPKWEKAQEALAREILASELERRKRWDAKGVPAPPSSSEHKIRWAVAHLEMLAEEQPMLSDTALKRVMGGTMVDRLPENAGYRKTETARPAPPPAPATTPTDLEASDLFAMAEAAGVKLTKAEMTKLLTGDVDFRAELLNQIAEKQEGERGVA
jgi:hypothetical protein